MSPTQNLTHDTTTPRSPTSHPAGPPAPASRRRIEVAAGIGLLALWAVSGFLLELGFVGVVLLGALLLAAFHTLVRRRPLRALLVRDTASFARRWGESCWSPPSWSRYPPPWCCTSLGGSRYGRYADDSWKALLMLVVLAGAYLASRRLVLTVLIGAVTVAVVSWVLSPNLADTRNGDATVLAAHRPASRQGHAGRPPRRRRRRGRPGRGPAGAAGGNRR